MHRNMKIDLSESIGFPAGSTTGAAREQIIQYITLKLIANGLPHPTGTAHSERPLDAERLLASYHQQLRKLSDIRCPVDARIEAFLKKHFEGVDDGKPLKVPGRTIILDRHGLARELALPHDADSYTNKLVSSYRVKNGVLHNPLHDRRTTKGTFHVTVGGLPVPRDKKAVPKRAFVELFRRAVNPPAEFMQLPFMASDPNCGSMVSLLLRPLLCPEVQGVTPEKTMEVRFFAPGALVSNLDFVESIFGNAGDPFLPENDSGLDVEHWSGHTGCVILAPHLNQVTRKELGLPHYDDATPRQRDEGMCWQTGNELYNDGSPFKITCRTQEGVIVTLISDNYYGYCKKEVKTQLSYAANLYGNVEEEHAGGAVAFASFNLGDEFLANSRKYNNRTFDNVAADYGDVFMDAKPEGYGVDKRFPEVIYVAEDVRARVQDQLITWTRHGAEHSIPLLPNHTYITPSGYKFRLEKHPETPTWRLIGTLAEGVFCHKPCTVSGGGKSEISKSIVDYVLHGPIFVSDLSKDLDAVSDILDRDYSNRWKDPRSGAAIYDKRPSRKLLDPGRSLGSVIKLLTPSLDYSDEYNAWLRSIPSYIYALVFIIKRMHRGDEQNWRDQFTVDIVNGTEGHELKFHNRKLMGAYLRVGLTNNGAWRTFKLRQDFAPAQKVQTEDDITASVVVPTSKVENLGDFVMPELSVKFARNCEYRLFQRPDDAIHRGLDKQTELDLSRSDNFMVNFEPLSRVQIEKICDRAVDLSQFTKPMQELLESVRDSGASFAVCSAEPRLIDGEPSRNPRYLQTRPGLMNTVNNYVAEMGMRLNRAIPADKAVNVPVHSVLLGRRNNPPDYANGIRPLAVYNPLHYQEAPELFMDLISALTGKSPSTTGAGSEGALTKGPFNAVLPITDLNNSLVSFLLTGLHGFSTPAGHIGPDVRVDHDISLLIPEIWCRLTPEERNPETLIREKLLEKIDDIDAETHSSRLGYRITSRFIARYVGRVFDNPDKVFDESILKPESQDRDAFIDGVKYITEAHQRVASLYFEDGSIDQACPPLKALLHIMAKGDYEGAGIDDPAVRDLFTLETMLKSGWYKKRLETRQQRDVSLWQRHFDYVQSFVNNSNNAGDTSRLQLDQRLKMASDELERVSAAGYVDDLHGFLGADPMQ